MRKFEEHEKEEDGFKTSLWATQEIKELKIQIKFLKSRPPPLEEENPNRNLFHAQNIEEMNAMVIMSIVT